MCNNNILMQFQADILGIPVERPTYLDITALGVAYAAGIAIDFWHSLSEIEAVSKIEKNIPPTNGL